jgi:hypothetical protein
LIWKHLEFIDYEKAFGKFKIHILFYIQQKIKWFIADSVLIKLHRTTDCQSINQGVQSPASFNVCMDEMIICLNHMY